MFYSTYNNDTMLKLKQMPFCIQLHICFCSHCIFSIFPSPLKNNSRMVINHTNEYTVLGSSFQGYISVKLYFSDKGVFQDNWEEQLKHAEFDI